jgi:hypothetical protein
VGSVRHWLFRYCLRRGRPHTNLTRADMGRTGNRFRSVLILAVLSAVVFGCEIVPDRAFASLEKALIVKIVEATRTASGGSRFNRAA